MLVGGGEWRSTPPSDDPFVRQELIETLYHVLWELVHVFLDHRRGSLRRRAGARASSIRSSASGGQRPRRRRADVAGRSRKAEEVGALREQTLTESASGSPPPRHCSGARSTRAGRSMRSATGARRPTLRTSSPTSGRARVGAARGSTSAPTADPDGARERHRPGGAVRAAADRLRPSGRRRARDLDERRLGEHLEALAEARRRGLATIALVGYDGGRIAAAGLADHVVVTRSDHIPRIQEAQASAYHVLRELVELI